MCRFTVYKGGRSRISDVIIRPSNSLLTQCIDGSYHPGVADDKHERNILLNLDGYGIAWYTFEKKGLYSPSKKTDITGETDEAQVPYLQFEKIRMEKHRSHIMRNPNPIASCQYLRSISERVVSPLFVAHIRAATVTKNIEGKSEIVGQNCHPFSFGKWTFVHNGCIPFFSSVKGHMLALMQKKYIDNICGTTDSEHIFALFLSLLDDATAQEHSIGEVYLGLCRTLSTVIEIMQFCGIKNASSLNICVTDGNIVASTRYRNSTTENPPSLYLRFGSSNILVDKSDEDQCYVLESPTTSRRNSIDTNNNTITNSGIGRGIDLACSKNSNNNSSNSNSNSNGSNNNNSSSSNSSNCSSPSMAFIVASSPLNKEISVVSVDGTCLRESQHNFEYREGEEEANNIDDTDDVEDNDESETWKDSAEEATETWKDSAGNADGEEEGGEGEGRGGGGSVDNLLDSCEVFGDVSEVGNRYGLCNDLVEGIEDISITERDSGMDFLNDSNGDLFKFETSIEDIDLNGVGLGSGVATRDSIDIGDNKIVHSNCNSNSNSSSHHERKSSLSRSTSRNNLRSTNFEDLILKEVDPDGLGTIYFCNLNWEGFTQGWVPPWVLVPNNYIVISYSNNPNKAVDAETTLFGSFSMSARIARSYEMITDLGYRFKDMDYDPTQVVEIVMRPIRIEVGAGVFYSSRHYSECLAAAVTAVGTAVGSAAVAVKRTSSY